MLQLKIEYEILYLNIITFIYIIIYENDWQDITYTDGWYRNNKWFPLYVSKESHIRNEAIPSAIYNL